MLDGGDVGDSAQPAERSVLVIEQGCHLDQNIEATAVLAAESQLHAFGRCLPTQSLLEGHADRRPFLLRPIAIRRRLAGQFFGRPARHFAKRRVDQQALAVFVDDNDTGAQRLLDGLAEMQLAQGNRLGVAQCGDVVESAGQLIEELGLRISADLGAAQQGSAGAIGEQTAELVFERGAVFAGPAEKFAQWPAVTRCDHGEQVVQSWRADILV